MVGYRILFYFIFFLKPFIYIIYRYPMLQHGSVLALKNKKIWRARQVSNLRPTA